MEPSVRSKMDINMKDKSQGRGKHLVVPQSRDVPSLIRNTKKGFMYWFASELQDRVKNDEFFKQIMAQKVSVPLRLNVTKPNLDLGSLVHKIDMEVILKNCEVSSLETEPAQDLSDSIKKTSNDLVLTHHDNLRRKVLI